MSVLLLILGLFLFICLVVVHELGHFLVARRNGVDIEEFGIGFPPRAWSRKTKNGFIFSINWLPLGGFVRLKGEHDADNDPGTFGAASLWAKSKIMVAGVVMNLIAAFVILTILAWVGMPKLINNQYSYQKDTKTTVDKTIVGAVEKNSPASSIGLKENDQLLKIGTAGGSLVTIKGSNNLPNVTQQFAGQKVDLIYKRGGQVISATTTLRSAQVVKASLNTSNQKGYLGVEPFEYRLQTSTWSAPIVAAGLIKQFTVLTFQGLWSIVRGLYHGSTSQATAQVSGPVGIFFLLKYVSTLGYQFVLVIIAVISLTLAIMNILPIPALDGGRLFVLLITNLFGKRLKQSTEELIHGTGFAVLLVLIVLITIVDVKRYF